MSRRAPAISHHTAPAPAPNIFPTILPLPDVKEVENEVVASRLAAQTTRAPAGGVSRASAGAPSSKGAKSRGGKKSGGYNYDAIIPSAHIPSHGSRLYRGGAAGDVEGNDRGSRGKFREAEIEDLKGGTNKQGPGKGKNKSSGRRVVGKEQRVGSGGEERRGRGVDTDLSLDSVRAAGVTDNEDEDPSVFCLDEGVDAVVLDSV